MAIKLTNAQANQLRNSDVYMIGRLPTKSEIVSEEDEIQIKDGRNVRFPIIALCKDTEVIEEINGLIPINNNNKSMYYGFDTNLEKYITSIYKYKVDKDKVELIRKIVSNKLIIFKTVINVKEDDVSNVVNNRIYKEGYRDYRVYKNVNIVDIVDNRKFDLENLFSRVIKINMNNRDFILKIMNQEYIEFSEYPTTFYSPKYIMCNDMLYLYEFVDNSWAKHENNPNMWSFVGDIKSIKVFGLSNENMPFIEASQYTYFVEEQETKSLKNILKMKDVLKNYDANKIVTEENDTILLDNGSKQYNFLKGIDIFCKRKGLSYEFNDIINLHISVKTNFITIIAGMTGTGKSQLAWAYAKLIDASLENKNLLFMPISPNYLEPADIIGYYNSNLGIFSPADTGLVDFLVNASKQNDKQYIIIFDEMNLSQVEYWFAPFISLFEADENNRYLMLYSKNNRCLNEDKYPNKIKIGKNIRIIGTINLDETTKELSDRLLDRANMITLEKKKFSDLLTLDEQKICDTYEDKICRDFEEYKSWIVEANATNILKKNELVFFDKLHSIISKYDPRKGVSFRAVNSIASYIANIPKDLHNNLMISSSYAFDIQIKQRIISKIKGSNQVVGKLIGKYDFKEDIVIDSEIIDFLNEEENKEISDFKYTRDLIKNKAKELVLYGYTY